MGKLTASVELGAGKDAMPNPTPIAVAAAAPVVPAPTPFIIKRWRGDSEVTMLPKSSSAGPLNPVTGLPTEL